MYLYRPHPVFQRYKYNITGMGRPCGERNNDCKYLGMGEGYKLTRIQLPKWNQKCEDVRQSKPDYCSKEHNETNANIEPYTRAENGASVIVPEKDRIGPCDYREDKVFKVFVGKLRAYAPEAWFLLKKMQVVSSDLEEMMADMIYNQTLRAQFRELQPGTTDTYVVNEGKMRRQMICKWVRKNTPRIQKEWVPTSATVRRCLGEKDFLMSSTGVYTPSVTCSGHGTCEPDPWLPFAGACKCAKGYEYKDCSILSEGEVVNAVLFHPTEKAKSEMAEYFLYGMLGMLLMLVILANWTAVVRDTPIYHNLASAHSFVILGAGALVILSYPLWNLRPTRYVCAGKYSLFALGEAMLIGINSIKADHS